jgi:hypothetical protein
MYDDVVKPKEKKVKYHTMKTRWDYGSIDMKESYVSGEHIAKGFDKLFKNMGLPMNVKFSMTDGPDGSKNRWQFCLTIDGEKEEG